GVAEVIDLDRGGGVVVPLDLVEEPLAGAGPEDADVAAAVGDGAAAPVADHRCVAGGAEVVDLDGGGGVVAGLHLVEEPLVGAGLDVAEVVDVGVLSPAADHGDVARMAEVTNLNGVGYRVVGVGGAQVPGAGAGPEDANVRLAAADPVAGDGDVAGAAKVVD